MLAQLVLIFVLGAICQWLAWRFKIPAILALLLSGIIVGPITGILNPDAIFGNLLFPIVSLSVAVILYEGGLDLNFSEIKGKAFTITSLVSFGCLVNWLLISFASYYLLGYKLNLSLLIGGILTVSGPTVIQPLLSHIKPRDPCYSILKWEGILIDPIGAVLAVLILEEILIAQTNQQALSVAAHLAGTLIVGVLLGFCFGKLFTFLTKSWSFPEELYNTISIACLFAAFYCANLFFHEAGLVAVTIMGITIGNGGHSAIREVIAFKENLRVLLISSLFIVLAARIELNLLLQVSSRDLLFLVFIIFIARPVSVFIATSFQDIKLADRIFIAGMFPRGIVAAAVSSLFAIKMSQENIAGADKLVTTVFLVIVSTVTIYAITGSSLARILKVKMLEPTGILIVGINLFSKKLAELLLREELDITIVDTNISKVISSRLAGFPAIRANILAHNGISNIEITKIGYAIATTTNHEANSLISLKMEELLGKGRGLQLLPEKLEQIKDSVEAELRGNFFPAPDVYLDYLIRRLEQGAEIKIAKLTDEYTKDDIAKNYKDIILLFRVRDKRPAPFTESYSPETISGDKLIFIGTPIIND